MKLKSPKKLRKPKKRQVKDHRKKEKNPKRVAAGKKGAKVRWSKQMQDVKSSPVPAEQAEPAAGSAVPAELEKITRNTTLHSSLESSLVSSLDSSLSSSHNSPHKSLSSSHNSPHKSHNSPPQTVVNVYKNYIPLALVAAGAVGVWIFAKFAKSGGSDNKRTKRITPPAQPSAQPSTQPSAQPASASLLCRRQPEIDPFEMR